MELYVWSILVPAVTGILTALAASVGLRWSISRRCYKLELLVLDLQQVIASLKGKESAEKRWAKSRDLEAEIVKFKPDKAQPREREFANDFFGMDEHGVPR